MSSRSIQVSECPFLRLTNISLCISIHLSMDTGCFYLLAIVNNTTVNTGVQMSLWDPAFISFGVHKSVVLLNFMVVVVLVFWGPSILFTTVATSSLHSHQHCSGVPFSPHPCQHCCFLLAGFFFIVAILMGMRCISLVLVCISLMITRLVIMCVLAIKYIFGIVPVCVATRKMSNEVCSWHCLAARFILPTQNTPFPWNLVLWLLWLTWGVTVRASNTHELCRGRVLQASVSVSFVSPL